MVSKGHTNGKKIMIVMHGLGDSLDSYEPLAKEINVTGLHYLLVNAPKSYFFGHSWYDIPPGNPRQGIDESVKKLQQTISELNDQGFKNEDIFLLGFSQGGCIAMETLYSLKGPLAGIIALSPRLYLEKLPSSISKTPIFMAHGKTDEAINFNETFSNMNEIKKLNPDLEFHAYDYGHTFDIDTIMDLRVWLNNHL